MSALPSANGKDKIFSVVCLNSIDSYNFSSLSLDSMAKTYRSKIKTIYPNRYFGLGEYNRTTDDVIKEDFKSTQSKNLLLQQEVDEFNIENRHKTGAELKLEYLKNDVKIMGYCFIDFVRISMREFDPTSLHYFSLPGYNKDYWLKTSGVKLETLKGIEMIKDFNNSKKMVYVMLCVIDIFRCTRVIHLVAFLLILRALLKVIVILRLLVTIRKLTTKIYQE